MHLFERFTSINLEFRIPGKSKSKVGDILVGPSPKRKKNSDVRGIG
jgi:hypothetical protein